MSESSTTPPESANIGLLLTQAAAATPEAIAVAAPRPKVQGRAREYDTINFQEFEQLTNRLAQGLIDQGVTPGKRIALMVKPGIEFIALTFALFKSGAVSILIDPGMGGRRLLKCLDQVRPDGFVAISAVHAIRRLLGRRYRYAKILVTVGKRWFWGGATYDQLATDRSSAGNSQQPAGPASEVFTPFVAAADDPAAIIFTTGSTGPPKGVLYRHGNFARQVTEIRDQYQIQPGEVDLPGFPLFGLFNAAMGVTTVIPDMDPTQPAKIDPTNVLEAAADWNLTQAFGSPAIWRAVGNYCQSTQERMPTIRRILSAGAPVPPQVLSQMTDAIAEGGLIHTPYGATEALPVATISSAEVLSETAARSNQGAGTCVGRRFPGIQWKVIAPVDRPIGSLAEAEELPLREIGELIVSGPVVTTEYVTSEKATTRAKIPDGDRFWHRMGDVGYLDEQERFWFCGRMAHRVDTSKGPLHPVCYEAIFNQHPAVLRTALVGVGQPGAQQPVLVIEPLSGQFPHLPDQQQQLFEELYQLGQQHELTQEITRESFLLHRSLPVDIRHNAKIFREKLAVWATKKMPGLR